MMRNALIKMRHNPMNFTKAYTTFVVSLKRIIPTIPTSNRKMLTSIYFFHLDPSLQYAAVSNFLLFKNILKIKFIHDINFHNHPYLLALKMISHHCLKIYLCF